MNKEEIMKILPHRDNMLLVEQAQVVDGVAHGRYTVRGERVVLAGTLSWQSGGSGGHFVRNDGPGHLRTAV